GGPRGGLGESGWLALARLVKPGVSPTCFRRRPDGSFDAVAPGELAGEGFLVVPFAVSGESGGALVLHSLVSPAQVFTRGRALSLLGEIVGQVLTIARMRASVAALCGEQATLLDRVLSNTRTLSALIDDILFFVQLEAERVPLRREEVRTAALIEAVMADLPPPAERARVPLRVAIAAEAASLRIDEALVRRLLFHLLSNAFKFTSEGEVTVAVRPGEERGSAVLAVRDTGAGI